MSASRSNNPNAAGPYVSLSAHCDLLHFVGPVPHPYGGPTPQTIADRASRYVRFSRGSPEKTPTLTVKCEHALFSTIPLTVGAKGEMMSSLPFSGVELARQAYVDNFESAKGQKEVKEQQQREKRKKLDVHQYHPSEDESSISKPPLVPQAEVESTETAGNLRIIVNFHTLRRTLLQTLFILNLPKRNSAVSFTLSLHDPRRCGVTRFYLLPRCAEQIDLLASPAEVSLGVVTGADGDDIFQCCCQCHQRSIEKKEERVEECRVGSSPLLWGLHSREEGEANDNKSNTKDPLELNGFLNGTMIPLLFTIPLNISCLIESSGEGGRLPQVVGWSQRRSFSLLALIAHCVWCEKVAWYIKNRTNGLMTFCESCEVRLKSRDNSSLESADKWESTLLFYSTTMNRDDQSSSREKKRRLDVSDSNTTTPCSLLLQVTLRGCDEQINWKWCGENPHTSSGSLSDLSELHEKR